MEWRWSWVGVEMELGVELELGNKVKHHRYQLADILISHMVTLLDSLR